MKLNRKNKDPETEMFITTQSDYTSGRQIGSDGASKIGGEIYQSRL